jgi:mono/diheme cytochrome c family protein
VAAILDGKGTLMPAFRERVTPEQVQALVLYVRSFAPRPVNAVKAEPANDFDKKMRELQDQLDGLQKQSKDAKPPSKP